MNLFEGFFDFLTYKTLTEKTECVNEDYCVHNLLSFLDKAKELISLYSNARIFFDHDKSGIRATKNVIKQYQSASDESGLHKNSKDLNEWLVTFGLPSKHSLSKSNRHTQ